MNVDKYGPLPTDADSLTRRCRLLQSWYRVEVLGLSECGPFRVGGRLVGSSLVGGEASGKNFISEVALAYARQRVADKVDNRSLLIEEYRLFNNMLSSQPMCFNLFSDIRAAVLADEPAGTDVLAAVFRSSPIAKVRDVVVEMIPTPTDEYIDDKTAFDAAVFYDDADDQPCLASIETKYTDKLGKNPANRPAMQFALAERIGLFTEEGLAHYKKMRTVRKREQNGFDQIARNLLLTLAYKEKHGLATAINYILTPEQDTETPERVRQLQAHLSPEYRSCIELLPLEEVIHRGLSCPNTPFAQVLQTFHKRYLDFTPLS